MFSSSVKMSPSNFQYSNISEPNKGCYLQIIVIIQIKVLVIYVFSFMTEFCMQVPFLKLRGIMYMKNRMIKSVVDVLI